MSSFLGCSFSVERGNRTRYRCSSVCRGWICPVLCTCHHPLPNEQRPFSAKCLRNLRRGACRSAFALAEKPCQRESMSSTDRTVGYRSYCRSAKNWNALRQKLPSRTSAQISLKFSVSAAWRLFALWHVNLRSSPSMYSAFSLLVKYQKRAQCRIWYTGMPLGSTRSLVITCPPLSLSWLQKVTNDAQICRSPYCSSLV